MGFITKLFNGLKKWGLCAFDAEKRNPKKVQGRSVSDGQVDQESKNETKVVAFQPEMDQVKVYCRVNDGGDWDDQGTGHVIVDCLDQSPVDGNTILYVETRVQLSQVPRAEPQALKNPAANKAQSRPSQPPKRLSPEHIGSHHVLNFLRNKELLRGEKKKGIITKPFNGLKKWGSCAFDAEKRKQPQKVQGWSVADAKVEQKRKNENEAVAFLPELDVDEEEGSLNLETNDSIRTSFSFPVEALNPDWNGSPTPMARPGSQCLTFEGSPEMLIDKFEGNKVEISNSTNMVIERNVNMEKNSDIESGLTQTEEPPLKVSSNQKRMTANSLYLTPREISSLVSSTSLEIHTSKVGFKDCSTSPRTPTTASKSGVPKQQPLSTLWSKQEWRHMRTEPAGQHLRPIRKLDRPHLKRNKQARLWILIGILLFMCLVYAFYK